jgi:hypothetical protein
MRADKRENKKFIRGFIFGFIFASITVTPMFFVVNFLINKPNSMTKPIIVNNDTFGNKNCCLIAKGICQVIEEPSQCETGIIVNCSSIICNPMLA